jgi:hypothetical protein
MHAHSALQIHIRKLDTTVDQEHATYHLKDNNN